MESKQAGKRLRISELNPHLLCALCGGYLIDATTIIECLHSFCKTCIVRYLDTSNYCPICEVLIHKTRPWQNIRPDHALQNAVYKMVPGLFQSEMKRRKEFYDKNMNEEKQMKPSQILGDLGDRIIFSKDEHFSISIEYSPNGKPLPKSLNPSSKVLKRQRSQPQQQQQQQQQQHPYVKRFLSCPADFKMGLLKKFIRAKFSLPHHVMIDLFYDAEPLSESYSLIDIAYIYLYKRDCVLRLFYSFYELPPKSCPSETITKTVAEKVKEKHESRGREMRERAAEREKEESRNSNKLASSNVKKESTSSTKPKVSGQGGKISKKRDTDHISVNTCLGSSTSYSSKLPSPSSKTKVVTTCSQLSPSPSKRKSVDVHVSQTNNYIPEKKLKKEAVSSIVSSVPPSGKRKASISHTQGPSPSDSTGKNKNRKTFSGSDESSPRSFQQRDSVGSQNKLSLNSSDSAPRLEHKVNNGASNNVIKHNNNNNTPCPNHKSKPVDDVVMAEHNSGISSAPSQSNLFDRMSSLSNKCPTRETNFNVSKSDKISTPLSINTTSCYLKTTPSSSPATSSTSSSVLSNLVHRPTQEMNPSPLNDDVQVIKVEIVDSPTPSPSKSLIDSHSGTGLDGNGQPFYQSSSSISFKLVNSFLESPAKSVQSAAPSSRQITKDVISQSSSPKRQALSSSATSTSTITTPTTQDASRGCSNTTSTNTNMQCSHSNPEISSASKISTSQTQTPASTSRLAETPRSLPVRETPKTSSPSICDRNARDLNEHSKTTQVPRKLQRADNDSHVQVSSTDHPTVAGPVSKSTATQVTPDSSDDTVNSSQTAPLGPVKAIEVSQVNTHADRGTTPNLCNTTVSTTPEDLSSARCTPIDMVVSTNTTSNLKSTGTQVSVEEGSPPPRSQPSPSTKTHSNGASEKLDKSQQQRSTQRPCPYDFKSTQSSPSPPLKSKNFGGQIDFVVDSASDTILNQPSLATNTDDHCLAPTDLSCKSSKVSVSLSPSSSRPNCRDNVTTSTSIATQTDHTNDKTQQTTSMTSMTSDTPTVSVSLSDSEANSPPSSILKLPSVKVATSLESLTRRAATPALSRSSPSLDLTSSSKQPPLVKAHTLSEHHIQSVSSSTASQAISSTTSSPSGASERNTSDTNPATPTANTTVNSQNLSKSSTSTVQTQPQSSTLSVNHKISRDSISVSSTPTTTTPIPKTYISIPDMNGPKLTIVNNEAASAKLGPVQRKNMNASTTTANEKPSTKPVQTFNKHLTAIAKPIEPLKLTVTLSPNETKDTKSPKRGGEDPHQQNTPVVTTQNNHSLSKTSSSKNHSVSRLIASTSPSTSSTSFKNSSSSSSPSINIPSPSSPPASPKTPPCTVIQTTKISTLIPKSSSISSKAGGSKHSFSYPSSINNIPSSRSFLPNAHQPSITSRPLNHSQQHRLNAGSNRKSSDKDSMASSSSSLNHHHSKHSSKHGKVSEGRVVKPTTKAKATKTIPPLSIPKSCLISPTLKLQRSPGSTDHYNIYPLPTYHLAANHHHNGDTSGASGSGSSGRQRSKDSNKHHNNGGSRTPTSPPTSTKDSVFLGSDHHRPQQRVPSIKISDINRNPIIVGSGKGSPSTNKNNNNGNNNNNAHSNNNNNSNNTNTNLHPPHPRSNSHGSSVRSSSSSEGGSTSSISSSSSSNTNNIRSTSRGSSGSSRSDSPDSQVLPLRSPVKDLIRRPTTESDFLLGHAWPPHSAAATEFFLNAFKIPAAAVAAAAAAAAKYHNLHYDTDAMPLDYSQSSSKL